jgi:hypothetical protein
VNVADLLAERLGQLGVRRVFGHRLPTGADAVPGLRHVPLDDPDLAVLLADADGRIGEVDGRGRLGAALLSGGILHLSSQPSGRAPLQTIGSADDLLDALADPAGLRVPATTALHLDLDLTAPAPPGSRAAPDPDRRPVLTLSPTMAELSMLMLVGPGVVRAGSVGQLRDLARRIGVGVLNTWGAKGVEHWDSRWHLGTAGLQADDLHLAGLDRADVVLTCGLDPAELPADALARVVVQDVPPSQLGALCAAWPATTEPPPGSPTLFDALAAVVRPLYEDAAAPLNPARASLHLSGALPDAAMAVADPGAAGFWVARTFPTSIPNSVCVPAGPSDGFAVAAAVCGGLDGRVVLAVTDEVAFGHPLTGAGLELARRLGVGVGLQVWGPGHDPARSTAEAHVELLSAHLAAVAAGEVRFDRVAIDDAPTSAIVEVAGGLVPAMRHE